MDRQLRIVSYVLKASALVTAGIGLSLLLYSEALVSWFSSGSRDNEHFAVYLGTALIGFSVTNWLYSKSHNLQAVVPALMGNLVSLITALVIDVISVYTGIIGMTAWAILALHVVFAAAFAYCALTTIRITGREVIQ